MGEQTSDQKSLWFSHIQAQFSILRSSGVLAAQRELYMDFAALLRAEKEKARNKQSQTVDSSAKTNQSTATAAITWPAFSLSDSSSINLSRFSVGSIPTVYYIPDFITDADEIAILAQVNAVPADHERWTTLRTRRLQCWGGQIDAQGQGHDSADLCSWLRTLCASLVQRGVFTSAAAPNHVLINEYSPGQGIMPHTDGPRYVPMTATLSLESDAVMNFALKASAADIGVKDLSPVQRVILRRRSLVVFADAAYSEYTHSIDAVHEDVLVPCSSDPAVACCPIVNETVSATESTVITRGRRVSITLRRVAAAAAAESTTSSSMH
jgi:alkylated DNA repair protein alkB homolog 6